MTIQHALICFVLPSSPGVNYMDYSYFICFFKALPLNVSHYLVESTKKKQQTHTLMPPEVCNEAENDDMDA